MCTTHGAYLMRSYTDVTGVTKYDPPVRFSDSTDDVRDVATLDWNADGLRDLVVVTGPHSEDKVYLADPTDPLFKSVGGGVDGSQHQLDQGAQESGDLAHTKLCLLYTSPSPRD